MARSRRAGGRLSTQHIISMQCISTAMNANLSLGKRGAPNVTVVPLHPPNGCFGPSQHMHAHFSISRKFWIVAYVAHMSVSPTRSAGQQVAESVMCSYLACSLRQGWHGAKSAICFIHMSFPHICPTFRHFMCLSFSRAAHVLPPL